MSSSLTAPPLASIFLRRTVSRMNPAVLPDITDVLPRMLVKANRGLNARPHMP